MPELERWVLHRLADLDAELREAAEGFEFNRYTRLLTAFANDDLSAFFFDIRKDSLYCDAPVVAEAPRLPHRARHHLPRAGALAVAGALLHHRGGLADPLSRTAARSICSNGRRSTRLGATRRWARNGR